MKTPNGTQPVSYVLAHALGVVAALLLTSCSGDGRSHTPTQPFSPSPPLPPAANLTGTWTGTVGVTYDAGPGEEGSCAEPVTATFEQSGSAVSGTLTDSLGCHSSNQYRFEGTLEVNLLHGSIIFPEFTWPTYGEVSGDHLVMTAFNVRWDLRR
jgi:hypothetical protein